MRIKKNRTAIIVFLKYPKIGQVKTRLAKDLGKKEALRIYQILLRYTIAVIHSIKGFCVKWYINELPLESTLEGIEKKDFKLQASGDLGYKMKSAIIAEMAHYEKVMVVGSDCPEIDSDLIYLAENMLNNFDVVVGPSIDGGYYFLGLKEVHEEIFSNIEWSSASVASSTIKLLLAKKLRIFMLPLLGDVDHASDWNNYKNKFDHINPAS